MAGGGEGGDGAGVRAERAVWVRGAHVRPAGDGVSTVEGVRLTPELLTVVMVVVLVMVCVGESKKQTDRYIHRQIDRQRLTVHTPATQKAGKEEAD